MTVLKRARKAGIQTPIIILTANAGVDWRIAGLDGGADDYLTKPFEVGELEARLRALIRRRNSQTATEIVIGALSLDTATRQFCLKGEPLALTPREHSVLELLVMDLLREFKRRSEPSQRLSSATVPTYLHEAFNRLSVVFVGG